MRTLNDYFINAEIEDISTASSTFVAVPDGGRVIKIITALQVLFLDLTQQSLLKLVVPL